MLSALLHASLLHHDSYCCNCCNCHRKSSNTSNCPPPLRQVSYCCNCCNCHRKSSNTPDCPPPLRQVFPGGQERGGRALAKEEDEEREQREEGTRQGLPGEGEASQCRHLLWSILGLVLPTGMLLLLMWICGYVYLDPKPQLNPKP